MKGKTSERLMQIVFFIAACTSVLAVALICIFLFANGIPAIAKIGIPDFLLGQKWKPSNNLYGILPFILGSIYVTAGSIVIGVPLALLLSVFLAFYCPKRLYPVLKTMVNLMAGIPSVVYGFFGLVMIVPLMRQITGKDGSTMLTASILLGIMILPTVTGVTESALRSVPMIGETMAVIMVAGNQTWMPQGLLKGVRTMTTNIVMEMGYAADLHREALIATGVVLFVFILIINLCVSALKRKAESE